MSIDDTFLHQAMDLAPADRAELARKLLLSLHAEPPDPDAEDLWAAEIEARLADSPAVDTAGSDWRESIDRVRHSLKPGPKT